MDHFTHYEGYNTLDWCFLSLYILIILNYLNAAIVIKDGNAVALVLEWTHVVWYGIEFAICTLKLYQERQEKE
jgi:hypothetical protein